MLEHWWVIAGLAVATFSIRLSGYLVGARLPTDGGWARAFNALPGCLIAALLTVILIQGEWQEWGAAGIALSIAVVTRSLPATMIVGVLAVWILRNFV